MGNRGRGSPMARLRSRSASAESRSRFQTKDKRDGTGILGTRECDGGREGRKKGVTGEVKFPRGWAGGQRDS